VSEETFTLQVTPLPDTWIYGSRPADPPDTAHQPANRSGSFAVRRLMHRACTADHAPMSLTSGPRSYLGPRSASSAAQVAVPHLHRSSCSPASSECHHAGGIPTPLAPRPCPSVLSSDRIQRPAAGLARGVRGRRISSIRNPTRQLRARSFRRARAAAGRRAGRQPVAPSPPSY